MLILAGEEACLLVVSPAYRSARCYKLLSVKNGEGKVAIFGIFLPQLQYKAFSHPRYALDRQML